MFNERYSDEVLCNVVPAHAYYFLLGSHGNLIRGLYDFDLAWIVS